MINKKGLELRNTQMDLVMKDILKKGSKKEKVVSFGQMDLNTLVNSRKISLRDMDSTSG